MAITVEFYGIARRRAGVEQIEIEAATLGEALQNLAVRLPTFAADCLTDGQLSGSFLANRNGCEFLTNTDEPLNDGDSLLILSADVGG